jgi:hypothetical protein
MGEREERKRGIFSFRFFFAYVILGFQEKDCQAWRAAVERIASSEGKKCAACKHPLPQAAQFLFIRRPNW